MPATQERLLIIFNGGTKFKKVAETAPPNTRVIGLKTDVDESDVNPLVDCKQWPVEKALYKLRETLKRLSPDEIREKILELYEIDIEKWEGNIIFAAHDVVQVKTDENDKTIKIFEKPNKSIEQWLEEDVPEMSNTNLSIAGSWAVWTKNDDKIRSFFIESKVRTKKLIREEIEIFINEKEERKNKIQTVAGGLSFEWASDFYEGIFSTWLSSAQNQDPQCINEGTIDDIELEQTKKIIFATDTEIIDALFDSNKGISFPMN